MSENEQLVPALLAALILENRYRLRTPGAGTPVDEAYLTALIEGAVGRTADNLRPGRSLSEGAALVRAFAFEQAARLEGGVAVIEWVKARGPLAGENTHDLVVQALKSVHAFADDEADGSSMSGVVAIARGVRSAVESVLSYVRDRPEIQLLGEVNLPPLDEGTRVDEVPRFSNEDADSPGRMSSCPPGCRRVGPPITGPGALVPGYIEHDPDCVYHPDYVSDDRNLEDAIAILREERQRRAGRGSEGMHHLARVIRGLERLRGRLA